MNDFEQCSNSLQFNLISHFCSTSFLIPISLSSVINFSLKRLISQKWPDNFFSFFLGMKLQCTAMLSMYC